MTLLADLAESFVLGVLTPLSAVCVLPLYPGFLAYLSSRLSGEIANRKTILKIGLSVTIGVISFMFLIGLVFTTLLQVSLTQVIGIVSPIAFGLLIVLSILLILDVDIGRFIPRTKVPTGKTPWVSAFLYGFFFGAIVIPCNPLFIAVFFTRSVSGLAFGANLLRFITFGLGLATPLLALAVVSTAASGAIIRFLTKHKSIINRSAGIIMLGISLYYLIAVFDVIGMLFG
ncbi:cytochrome c biogenesis CcdA family protein [Candidatus Bipolaricaulota bacterium]